MTIPHFVEKDVPSALMRQTLLDAELVRPATSRPIIRLLPQLKVGTLGGRSIIDRGGEAILPIVDELRDALPDHKMLVLTGPGIRARHVLGVGLDLGLPTGVLAAILSTDAEHNGHLIAALRAEHGVSYLPHTTVSHQLAVHLAACNCASPTAFRRTSSTSTRLRSARSRRTARTRARSSCPTPTARRRRSRSRTSTASSTRQASASRA